MALAWTWSSASTTSSQVPADMDRPGQGPRFICPWDWAIQGPIDLEDRRPDLPPRQPPPVPRADTVAADSNRRPRHHVQHHRVAGRKLVEGADHAPGLDAATPVDDDLGQRLGDALGSTIGPSATHKRVRQLGASSATPPVSGELNGAIAWAARPAKTPRASSEENSRR